MGELTESQKEHLQHLVEATNFSASCQEILTCPLCGLQMKVINQHGTSSQSMCVRGHIFAMNLTWSNN